MTERSKKSRRTGRRRGGPVQCIGCKETVDWAWTCRKKCGFVLCQRCMQDNIKLMTCNNITWECPDCGEVNSFGNQ